MAKKSIDTGFIRERCYALFTSKNLIYGNKDAVFEDNCIEFFNIKSVKTLLSDEDLTKTAELFFESDLIISGASKVGFMHRNTLIYRLDKIQKMMGLDIRNFNDAVLFSNMLLVYNNLNKD
ncbi:MAG: helix-turn-helix domain-containing protein [Clostridia bacterium]|nr:helix-turn-helix domain-containing protein [Clostridia bacterium]